MSKASDGSFNKSDILIFTKGELLLDSHFTAVTEQGHFLEISSSGVSQKIYIVDH